MGQFIDIGNLRLHYLRAGHGRPIVMIHGLGGLMQDFTSTVFYPLSDQFDMLTYDRPAYGFSKLPKGVRTSIPFQVQVLHEAITRLGIEKPLLVGHSMGGAIALRYAAIYPEEVSGMVLIAPVAYPVTRVTRPVERLLQTSLIESATFETLVGKVGDFIVPFTARTAWSPNRLPDVDMKDRVALSRRPSQYMAALADMGTMNYDVAAQQSRYAGIRVPTTIIAGDCDQLLNCRRQAIRLSRALPNATLKLFPQTGHMVQFVYPEKVTRIIQETAEHAAHGSY